MKLPGQSHTVNITEVAFPLQELSKCDRNLLRNSACPFSKSGISFASAKAVLEQEIFPKLHELWGAEHSTIH